ncbi:MAG: serine/threonine-protein phosphatase [Bacteroidaceae bacterium]|nr:serine/threonine-protein phosphatase [Bacteroidaceae bacterium]
MEYKIKVLSIYEKGHYRDTQEDSIFPQSGDFTADDRLFMVCDGMGGHEAGEVASQAVCEAMSRVIQELAPAEEVLTDEILSKALTEAYDLLDERDPNPESAKKMGTTMTLLKLHRDGATIAHIGDSRVYQFRPDEDGNMQVVHKTVDHSLVNDLLKVNELTPEEAENFPRKNVITRAMQSHLERRPKADVSHIEDVRTGDYFLLCSDGMLEHTSDQNLCYMIGMPETDDEKKIKMLKDTTEDNKDNHSAYLIHILDAEDCTQTIPVKNDEPQIQTTSQKPTVVQSGKNGLFLRYIIAAVTALLVIIGACIYATKYKKNDKQAKPEKKERINTIPSKDTNKN